MFDEVEEADEVELVVVVDDDVVASDNEIIDEIDVLQDEVDEVEREEIDVHQLSPLLEEIDDLVVVWEYLELMYGILLDDEVERVRVVALVVADTEVGIDKLEVLQPATEVDEVEDDVPTVILVV